MSSSSQQATGLSIQDKTGGWLKGLGWLAAIIIGIFIIINSFGGGGSGMNEQSKTKTDAYGWNLIETITCPMGKESWDNGQGWCTSQTKLEPGTYRLLLKEVRWEVAFWDPVSQRVAQYRPVPAQGIPLSEWGNDPSYMRDFLQNAPVGSNRHFGSIVAKMNGQAFDPFQKNFTVENPAPLSIGPNIPPGGNAFMHNRGVISVEIEKKQ